MIKKMTTLALTAGAAALSLTSPALADGLDDRDKPLVDSSTVTKSVVRKPTVTVDAVVGAVSKVTNKAQRAETPAKPRIGGTRKG